MDDGESTVAETIDRVAVASAIYDHVKAQLEVDARVYTTFQQKVRHLMTVHLALLAGLSYGLKHCGWAIQTSNSLHGLALAIIGGSSFFLVFAAFFCAVQCSKIRDGSVTGVTSLKNLISCGEMWALNPHEIKGQLAQNIATVILEDREKDRSVKPWCKVMNNTTVSGLISSAVFIAYATIGELATIEPQQVLP